MSSLTERESQILQVCMAKAAKGRKVAAACIYGSKAAGYARPDSDIDLLLVLEDYPYKVKYTSLGEAGLRVSALIVDRRALERDAKGSYLGEFVVGRLLHVYEPVQNAELLQQVERAYKRRVVLEELQGLVRSTGLLAADVSFPLEYVAFSKIRHRMSLYPNATYSYYRTYSAGGRNLELALQGYRDALGDIMKQDPELLVSDSGMLRLSEKRLRVARGEPSLLLAKRLHEFSSYFVHSYAGRRMYHLAINEAQSKIRRHLKQPVDLPLFMSCPACAYWELPEGLMIADSRKQDWLEEVARKNGIAGYSVAKRRIGNPNSRTMLYSLDGLQLAVKKLAKTKGVKWAALGVWTAYLKKFYTDPLLRLGTEYRALRHLRKLDLKTPAIEAVVLDDRLLVTRYVQGPSLADMIRAALKGGPCPEIREAGRQIALVHKTGACFGNIKPKNVIVADDLWFTDLEQFVFEKGDPAWDVIQFLCWGLKGTGNARAAAAITREFLEGYDNSDVTKKLTKSRRYMQTFYPVLSPQVAQAIRKEMT
jgi:tRNA A-37 threonylcarbamoyl transferase component Bud32/predicted nucleotidyltransferase